MKAPLSLLRTAGPAKILNCWWHKLLLLLLILSTFSPPIVAQTKLWDKTYGGIITKSSKPNMYTNEYVEYGSSSLNTIIRTPDGGYLLGGSSDSEKGGDKSQGSRDSNDYSKKKLNEGPFYNDYWIIKLDESGNKEWDKTFGGSGNDKLTALVAMPDGGYLLGGWSESGISGDKSQALVPGSYCKDGRCSADYWVVKIDGSGNKEWDKSFGGSGFDELTALVATPEGGFLLGGLSNSSISGDKTQANQGGDDNPYGDYNYDYWIVKINGSGKKMWDKTFGGNSFERLTALVAAPDGGYLLGGFSWSEGISGNKSEPSKGITDGWVVRIDDTGTKIWDKTFGGNDAESIESLVSTPDGGFLLGGQSRSGVSGDKSADYQGLYDYWLVKADSNGTKIWDKTFGGYEHDFLTTVVVTPAGDYLLGGTSSSGISGDKSEAKKGLSDYWVVKVRDDQPKSPYCIPAMTYGCKGGYGIYNFKFSDLFDEIGECGNYDDPESSYTNHYPYANVQDGYYTTTVKQGESYAISMESGSNKPLNFGVWIDYNDDKDFDDAGEFVYSTAAAGLKFSSKIIIPADASSGQRRLRVRSKTGDAFTALESCTPGTYGETDDYTIAVGYCTPYTWQGCELGEYVNDFSFNTLVNNNSGCNGNEGGYISYAPSGNLTTTVNKGQSYNISMQSGPEPVAFGVWIDYNNDKDFDDWGEFIYGSSVGSEKFTARITIPAFAATGQLRLRVRTNVYEFYSGEECMQYDPDWPFEEYEDSFFRGETEDYTITVADQEYQDLRYGGSGTDRFTVVIQTQDGGYLSGGYSNSPVSGDKSQNSQGGADYWIVKTDVHGTKQWDKRYGGPDHDYLNRIIPTQDGGYLLAGSSISGVGGDKTERNRGNQDYWLVKITSSGEKEWDKTYGGSDFDDLRKVNQLSNGDYLLAGTSSSPVSGEKSQSSQGGSDYWIIRVSSTGTKIWDKRYGSSKNESLESFTKTRDGGFLLAGSSASGKSGDKTQASRGGKDYWLVKIDQQGTQLWDKSYGGSKDDELYSIGITSSGEYFVAGHSTSGKTGDKSQESQGSSDYWMLKLDQQGEKLWDRSFGGSREETLRSIIQSSDGGYWLAGSSASGMGGDKTQESQGGTDYWLVKTDAEGYQEYDQRFGGSGDEEFRYIQRTQDGGVLLGGRSDSSVSGDRTQPSQGTTDYWLVKVGPAEPTSSPVARVEAQAAPAANLTLAAYPNPTAGQPVTVTFSVPQTQPVNLQVYDSQGRTVASLFKEVAQAGQQYQTTWPAKNQAAGMYILRLQTANKVSTHKLILTR